MPFKKHLLKKFERSSLLETPWSKNYKLYYTYDFKAPVCKEKYLHKNVRTIY